MFMVKSEPLSDARKPEHLKRRMLYELDMLKKSGKTVIVEGKKDKQALEKFGLSDIITLKKPLFAVVEDIVSSGKKEVVILTDLDREGKKLFSTLKKGFASFGVKIDTHFRDLLFRDTRLRQIEGIASYLGDDTDTEDLR
ncbi:toprim domain-containing protein [Candidatus Woesearchaeota archaeon]|nr:toprim domain-containing protein [Candidatus Woesearchaeota archaeon]